MDKNSPGWGTNTGFFKFSEINEEGETTAAHEFGHGIGEEHFLFSFDYRGLGQPPMGVPRGTKVDPEYQYDPKAKAGGKSGTLDPDKRKVTKKDIEALFLNTKKFDQNGKAKVGATTNVYHKKVN